MDGVLVVPLERFIEEIDRGSEGDEGWVVPLERVVGELLPPRAMAVV